MMRVFSRVVLVLLALALASCGESLEEQVGARHKQVSDTLAKLGQDIDSGQIRNANLVKQYAKFVAGKQADIAEMATELGKEGTRDALAYKSLGDRLAKVNLKPDDEKAANESMDQLRRLSAAADGDVYNDSLIDVVNVLADLSQGFLARLHVPETEKTSEQGAADRLVGNPAYGHWRQGPSGLTWFFLGRYSSFGGPFYGGGYHYDNWYRGRSWSYYNDVGRNYYGSRADNNRWNDAGRRITNTKPKKSYGSLRSGKRLSTYGTAQGMRQPSGVKRTSSRSGRSPYAASTRGSSRGGGRGGK